MANPPTAVKSSEGRSGLTATTVGVSSLVARCKWSERFRFCNTNDSSNEEILLWSSSAGGCGNPYGAWGQRQGAAKEAAESQHFLFVFRFGSSEWMLIGMDHETTDVNSFVLDKDLLVTRDNKKVKQGE
ncbi:hypothetical protein AXG93_1520s1060 [Marchantia polymorpha subsp. ruderalis]|uniref:Uncharacterized protein n=1 Tax=Marchantia polymorpha subsp. ruderalis TaxID=1480154 RepID=A0A176VHP5_MARPO|nr:hypothetical protein AXG93_1520s1060 [Marchantia polymorpha subsp. ruderalis]